MCREFYKLKTFKIILKNKDDDFADFVYIIIILFLDQMKEHCYSFSFIHSFFNIVSVSGSRLKQFSGFLYRKQNSFLVWI